jgi:cytoskeletal protein CcmA (bactofilin family)
MNSISHPRRPAALPDPSSGPVLGVRPGAGVLGLAKAEPADKDDGAAGGTLIVGEGIEVKGEIQSCTTLVVEGKVEASLEASQLTVRAGGLFDGTAAVETARIGGTVTGALTVRGLLVIEAGGRVTGTLRYGELQIDRGGHVGGDIDLLPPAATADAEAEAEAREPAAPAIGERLLHGAAAR